METKIRTKTVTETYYVSFDGREFKSPKKCEEWENFVRKHKTICPQCNGHGSIYRGSYTVYVEPEFRDLDDGTRYDYEECKKCGGKGYLLPRK